MFLLTLKFNAIFDCIFVQSFSCMFVGFNVRVKCESLVKNCEDNGVRDLLAIDLQVDNP